MAGLQIRQLVGDETVRFFVSPYLRARQTVLAILRAFDGETVQVSTEPRLREQDFGNFQTPTEMDEVFEAGSFTATHLASQQESAAAKASVDATTAHWMDVVTAPGDTSDEVSGLYAADAVFWGSVSEGVRVGE